MRRGWVVAFLSATATAVGMEIWAAADHKPYTRTWTDLITSTLPWWVTIPLALGFAAWLPWRFIRRYRTRRR